MKKYQWHALQEMLKTQELKNAWQAKIISQQELETIQQGEVITRLEEALMDSDRKCKPEVLETGKNKWVQYFMVFYFRKVLVP